MNMNYGVNDARSLLKNPFEIITQDSPRPHKSILIRRSSSNPLQGSASAPMRSVKDKKRVEIASPPYSSKSSDDLPSLQIFRETPLPRVALVKKFLIKMLNDLKMI
jgi:hypothetical protein